MQRIKTWLINRKRLSRQIPYRNRRIRFFILFLLSMIVFANMYTFNNPQALQDSIMKELQISQTQFNMLYTVIALPNIICPFFIGIIIDYIGIKVASIGLTFAVVILQVVVAQGAVNKSYNIMIIGRMLFGIAMQGLNVVQTCFVSYWFLGKELAFALGIATTIPELGSALNSYLTPLIYEQTKSLGPPLYASVAICFLSFICCCVAAYIDKRADNADKQRSIREQTLSQFNSLQTEPERIKFKDLKQLPGAFWLVVCICMFSIAQYIPFLDNVNKLLQVRFCFSQFSAGKNIMVTYVLTSVIGLPLGAIVDRIGFKRYLTIAGMAIFVTAHSIIYIFPQCNHFQPQPTWTGASFGLLLLGLAYCFYANCILPSIPVVVSKRIIGSAFGIMLVLQNFAMAVCPIIAGQIIEHSQSEQAGYKNQSLFYVLVGLMGFIISINLLFINKNSKLKLDGTSKQKKLLAVEMNNYIQFLQAGQNSPSSRMKQINLKQKLLSSYNQIQMSPKRVKQKQGKMIQSFQVEV